MKKDTQSYSNTAGTDWSKNRLSVKSYFKLLNTKQDLHRCYVLEKKLMNFNVCTSRKRGQGLGGWSWPAPYTCLLEGVKERHLWWGSPGPITFWKFRSTDTNHAHVQLKCPWSWRPFDGWRTSRWRRVGGLRVFVLRFLRARVWLCVCVRFLMAFSGCVWQTIYNVWFDLFRWVLRRINTS